MNRAIITGATGAAGTALTRELIGNGTEVLIFVNPGSARNDKIPAHPLVKRISCGLEDLENVENETGIKYDVFYHLAWQGTFGEARNDLYAQNMNVKYALDAVRASLKFGCTMFIGAGSQAEYGRVDEALRPDTPVNPENGYGIAKLCAYHMTKEYARRLGLKHIWVRILSLYGENDGENTMIMSTIRKFKNGETPIFTKGEQLWDYLNSEDAARALRLMGEKGVDGKVYVLGSGQARPLAEYIRDIRDCAAPGIEPVFGAIPYTEKQVMHLLADISELRNDLGWEPLVDFRQGIMRIIGDMYPTADAPALRED